MSRPGTVLLTGASGVVGQAILREAEGTATRFVALSRDGAAAVPEGAHRVLRGDLSLPRFGLDEEAFRAMAREVDAVVHSAGLTTWGLPAQDYEPVNIEGTRRVIEFAETAGAPVHFMSTAFVAAVDDAAPHRLSDGNVTAAYVRSKRCAERLLRDSGLPHTVFRPTNLIGHSTTGWTSRGQIVQSVSDWICRGRAPFIPMHAGNRIDIVPQDLLAAAVLGAIRQDVQAGEFWVTYGAEAMGMEAAVEVCAKHAAGLGRDLAPPPVVDPEALDEEALAELPPMTRSYLSVLRDVSEVTRCGGGVLPSSLPELRERFGIPYVADTDAYLRTLEFASAG